MKRVFALLMALAMMLALVACGGNSNNTTPDTNTNNEANTQNEENTENNENTEPQGRTYELTMASSDASGSVIGLVGEKIVELADQYSDGRIKITYHQDATLGTELENIQQLKDGEIDIAHFGDNFGSQICTNIDPTVTPFIFKTLDDVKAVYDDPVLGAAIAKAAKDNANCYLVGLQARTARLLTASRAIETPADLNGLKLRVPEIENWVTVWKSLGALPTPVAWAETYSALQTHVVDGQENPIDNIYANKIYEVNKYIMMTEHLYGCHHWCVNADMWDGMDAADREILQKAIDDADAWGDAELANLEKGYWDSVLEDGSVTVVEVDKAVWSSAAQAGIEEALSAFVPEAQEYVSNYLAG